MSIKLLVTARDAAAALHLIQVVLASRSDDRFDVVIAAQAPAASYFIKSGLNVRTFPPLSVRSADSHEANQLRALVKQLLAETRPDVVLVGLSTPFDAGLDEMVLAEASVPSILFQDFWGEQNLLLGKAADLVLSIDAEAASLNFTRYGIRSRIVGSARHAAYADLDIAGTRTRVRKELGIGGDENVVGFFGQALHHLPGYERTIQAYVSALTSIAAPFKLMVRPHPREDTSQHGKTLGYFKRSGITLIDEPGGAVERALIASDVVCSLFSTCTYDTAYLNRFSHAPVAVPISMLFDEEVDAYCRQHVNFQTFPYHRSGVVLSVHDSRELVPVLSQSLTRDVREGVWQSARSQLPDPVAAPQLTLDSIVDYLEKRRLEA